MLSVAPCITAQISTPFGWPWDVCSRCTNCTGYTNRPWHDAVDSHPVRSVPKDCLRSGRGLFKSSILTLALTDCRNVQNVREGLLEWHWSGQLGASWVGCELWAVSSELWAVSSQLGRLGACAVLTACPAGYLAEKWVRAESPGGCCPDVWKQREKIRC